MYNCPECGSSNVQVKVDEKQLRSYYHCNDCGKEWSRTGINRKREKSIKVRYPYTIPAFCLAGILLILVTIFSGCKSAETSEKVDNVQTEITEDSSKIKLEEDIDKVAANTERETKDTDKLTAEIEANDTEEPQAENHLKDTEEFKEKTEEKIGSSTSEKKELFSLDIIPEYSGNAYFDVNNDIPFFSEDELVAETFQKYWPLDELGRCTGAFACIGPETLPSESRENTNTIEPTGWQSVQYDKIDGGYLYNRCHLIGYQLTGQSTNERNLITGTRYMNMEGMLPFENSVQMYVEGTGNHVLYRVRPYYKGDDLVAAGVLMEAKSIEDPQVQFCAFCYNVQPGIEIDYATGDSSIIETTKDDKILAIEGNPVSDDSEEFTRSFEDEIQADEDEEANTEEESEEITFVLNTNTRKFHYPYCSSVKDIKDKNKRETTLSRDEIINQGYTPCKRCNP